MTKFRKTAIVAIAIGALVVGSPSVASAVPGGAGAGPEPDYLVPWEEDIPAEVSMKPLPAQFQSNGGPDPSVAEALLQLEVENPGLGIAGAEWDAERRKVNLYATSGADSVREALRTYRLDADVVPKKAARSAQEMKNEIKRLIGDGALPSGEAVVMAVPSLDGSSIALTLDRASANRRAMMSVPDVGPDVNIDFGEPTTPALRNHAPGITSNTYRYSGAYMHPGSGGCTTGYRGVRLSDSEPAMLSAEHCSVKSGTGTQWYYSSLTQHFIGQARGQVPGSGYRPDLASWTGGGVGPMVPGIFIGDNTVSGSTIHPVKGVAGAIVNSRVCYSGSFSGTVCGNIVNNTNATVCYEAPYGCYDHLVVTTHEYGTPAIGQGDSGGPAYISTSSGVQAAGFISGMSNGTTNCTGDAGGRLCSSVAFYAPIVDAIAGGFGINYIP